MASHPPLPACLSFWLCLVLVAVCTCSPLSNPLTNDSQIHNAVPDYYQDRAARNKTYHQNRPLSRDVDSPEASPSLCGLMFEPLWSTDVGAAVYSAPVVFPMHTDGAKEVLVSTFSGFLEIIEHDGYKPFGWPIHFENSEFHGSPVLHDVNGDQNTDVCIADAEGNLFWVQLGDYSKYLRDFSIKVPKLTVAKDWYSGLTGEFVEAYVHMSMFAHEKAGAEGIISADESKVKKAAEGDSLNMRMQGGGRKLQQISEEEHYTLDDVMPFDLGGIPHHPNEGRHFYDYGRGGFDDVFLYRDPYFSFQNESNKVDVDAHILSTPAIADVNDDGNIELVVSISYYFDQSKYTTITGGVDPSKYVAGGVGVWDLELKDWAWLVHLDLTTADTSFTAYIYSSPVVVDIDGDGKQEVIVGTSMGLVYVLDANTGFAKRHFPTQVGPIRAQITVADVAGDSDLELIVGDMLGNLVVMGTQGETIWDYQLTGAVHHAPTVGDVNGDGAVDIVCACITPTGESHVWAFDGRTGQVLPHFPLQTHHTAAVVSSVLLTNFHQITGQSMRSAESGMHLVVPAFDGHVYVIDGATGCTNRIDVGEHIYSMILADDVDGDGSMDLVIGTMNGQVIMLDSNTPYHPLYSWGSMPRHRLNGFTVGEQGVFFTPENGMYGGIRYIIRGPDVSLTFEIFDRRKPSPNFKYDVTITRGTSLKAVLFKNTYTSPGIYTAQLHLPRPERIKLVLSMKNDHSQYYEDAITLSVNEQFYKYIKFLIALPVCVCVIPLLMMTGKGGGIGLLP